MGSRRLVIFAMFPAMFSAGWGQTPIGSLGFGDRIGVQANLRSTRESSALERRFTSASRIREMSNARTFYNRILVDRDKHVYLGYEVLVEQQQPDTFQLTFGKLGVTPLEVASDASGSPRDLIDPPVAGGPSPKAPLAPWTMQQIPAIPKTRSVHGGETVSIELVVDAATGEKLMDDLRVNPLRPIPGPPPPVPTVSGTARDFSVADAEMEIVQPRLTLNGSPQTTSGPESMHNIHGTLLWLYFPGHGRYILSLAPRAELGFKPAGEVRGGAITFTLDGDSVRLESMRMIAGGEGAYHLYVSHDKGWAPVSERQKDFPADGSISVDELEALRRK